MSSKNKSISHYTMIFAFFPVFSKHLCVCKFLQFLLKEMEIIHTAAASVLHFLMHHTENSTAMITHEL